MAGRARPIVKKQRTTVQDLPSDWEELRARLLIGVVCFGAGLGLMAWWGTSVLASSPYCR